MLAFTDKKVTEQFAKIKKPKTETEEIFPEHEYVASCLRIGLSISDLEKLTYMDCLKILLSFITEPEETERTATQEDIDKLLG